MKKFIDMLWGDYVSSAVATVAVGLLVTVFHNVAMDIACIATGLAAAFFGIFLIVRYFSAPNPIERFSLFLGLVISAAGMYVVCVPSTLQNLLAVIFGIVILYHGIIDLQSTVTLKKYGYKHWVAALACSLAVALAGIVLIFLQNKAVKSLMLVLGIMLMLEGIVNIWLALRVKKFNV